MVLTSSAPLYSSLHGLLTIVIVAVASFDKVCDAFSIPRLPVSLQSHHHIRGWVNNDGDGNGNGGVDGIANCLNGDVCTLRMSDENVSMLVCRLLATCLEDGHVELILPLFNRNRWQSILAQSGNI